MDEEQTTRWRDLLRRSGHRPGAVLGSGMEGTVLDLGDDLVAKIWRRRTAGELAALATFYDAVAAAGPSLATPRIHRVLALDGRCASIERRLPGRPLWTADGSSPVLDDRTVTAVTDVLAALAAIEPVPAMAGLPVLEGEAPFPAGAGSFPRSLADLVLRRVARFHGPLSAHLPELDRLAAAVARRLRVLDPGPPGLVHGDLIPANILVDDARRPVAVLDFGFLTTVGDPAFDAAVTASIFDMYGPRAATVEAALDAAIAERSGHDPARLLLYRAGYALVTSNCFSDSGGDGHFAWCMRLLERPAIRSVLDG